MNESDTLAARAERFESWVWTFAAPELHEREGPFLQDCAGAGVRLEHILGEKYQSDETLALAVQKQFCPRWAFVELFVQRYGGELRRWFSRWQRNYRRDYHGEQDLVQGMLLKFLEDAKKLEKYEADRPFGPWLHTVARNFWITEGPRRRQLHPTDELPEAVVWITPDEEVMAGELKMRLDKALPRLPPDRREVMELTLQGLLPRDIAASLDLPLRKVYRLLCQARKWLVAELGLSLPPSPQGRPRRPPPMAPESR